MIYDEWTEISINLLLVKEGEVIRIGLKNTAFS